jgi:hypothetical protein
MVTSSLASACDASSPPASAWPPALVDEHAAKLAPAATSDPRRERPARSREREREVRGTTPEA